MNFSRFFIHKRKTSRDIAPLNIRYAGIGGHGGVVVRTNVGSEGRWFKTWSLPSWYFLRQEILLVVSLHPGPGCSKAG